MDRATVLALDRINRGFYAAHAAEFAATREAPWPGWERLVPHLAALPTRAGGDALRILDVGCGSGRLARWLDTRLERPHASVGLDRSLPILLVGRNGSEGDRTHDGPEGTRWWEASSSWILADLVSSSGRVPCRDAAFDAAVAIGLLHHLPSFELRRALLADLLRVVARGGLVAVAFWQFGADPRFERRAISWERAPPIDRHQLEAGDRLLRWGARAPDGQAPGTPSAGGLLRYCHYADPEEVDRLTSSLPADVVETFVADGRSGALNLYRVLRRR